MRDESSRRIELGMHRIAIVLAGGAGSRLGRDKAREPFFGSTLLDRVVDAAESAGFQVIVVASDPPPTLRSHQARRVVDPPERRRLGPLAGFATGLSAAPHDAAIALLLATDHPFLAPSLLNELAERLERDDRFDAVVPRIANEDHPLVSAYRTSLKSRIDEKLAGGERSLKSLLATIRVDAPSEAELRSFDPSLRSFLDVDDETDLARARELANESDSDARGAR